MILQRAVPILVAVSFVVASARPAMSVNNPATAQPYAGRAAAGNAAGLSPGTAQKTGRKAALRTPKKKKSSFSRKISEQVEKMRPKVQDIFRLAQEEAGAIVCVELKRQQTAHALTTLRSRSRLISGAKSRLRA